MARVSATASSALLRRLLPIAHHASSRPLHLLYGAPRFGALARVGLDGSDPDLLNQVSGSAAHPDDLLCRATAMIDLHCDFLFGLVN